MEEPSYHAPAAPPAPSSLSPPPQQKSSNERSPSPPFFDEDASLPIGLEPCAACLQGCPVCLDLLMGEPRHLMHSQSTCRVAGSFPSWYTTFDVPSLRKTTSSCSNCKLVFDTITYFQPQHDLPTVSGLPHPPSRDSPGTTSSARQSYEDAVDEVERSLGSSTSEDETSGYWSVYFKDDEPLQLLFSDFTGRSRSLCLEIYSDPGVATLFLACTRWNKLFQKRFCWLI